MLSFIISNLLIIPSIVMGSVSPYTADIVQEPKEIKSQTLFSFGYVEPENRDSVQSAMQLTANTYYAFDAATDGIVGTAMSLRGVPYVFAGSAPSGFDCSGFTAYVYGKNGIQLPHSASAQAGMGIVVSEDQATPGDLVYMPGHIGIWLAPGVMIDSAEYGTVVDVRKIWGTPQIIHIG